MTHSDFKIGESFYTPTGEWRCTDIGTRTIAAIYLEEYPKDTSWYNGPPYAVQEIVFDEYDMPGCSRSPIKLDRTGNVVDLPIKQR